MLVGWKDVDDTVAVIFGGRSSEHEISLRSALHILRNIPDKYHIIPVGIGRDGEWWSLEGVFTSKDFVKVTEDDLGEIAGGGQVAHHLQDGKPIRSVLLPCSREVLSHAAYAEGPVRALNLEAGVFFPVVHGTNGEDGRLQGLFELASVPYVGCDLRSSVIGIDKNIQKILARAVGVPVVRFEMITREEWDDDRQRAAARVAEAVGFPAFVKPNSLGSTVGTNRARTLPDLEKRIAEAFLFDSKILVESEMKGTEVECSYLGTPAHPQISQPGEIAPKDFYSYAAKYMSTDGANLFVPARISAESVEELRAYVKTLARVFGVEGLCRFDFWYQPENRSFVFNEINTIPGMTPISMFPRLWDHDGIDTSKWIMSLLDHAKKRWLHDRNLSVEVNESSPNV